jgi:hypothetical protein
MKAGRHFMRSNEWCCHVTSLALAKLGLPYVRVFPDMSSFSGFRIVSGGCYNFTKMSGFLAFVESHTQFFGGRYVRYSS